MPTNIIRIYIKSPGAKAVLPVKIANTLENLQQLVGGYIETLTLPGNVVAIFNEEGRLKGMPFNFSVQGVSLVGPVIIAGTDGDEFADAPFPTAGAVKNYFFQMHPHRCMRR